MAACSVNLFIVFLSFNAVWGEEINEFEEFLQVNKTVECRRSEFQCLSRKKCIPKSKRCDGKIDCPDSSDESIQCKDIKSCPYYSFTCSYGACIDGKAECDGVQDCADNSDENTPRCPKYMSESADVPLTVCSVKQFVCSNGQCIDKFAFCDGTKHCQDGSDETKPACSNITCPYYSYQCAYGACVHKQAMCNGIVDCVDGSDEDSRICKKSTTASPYKPVWQTTYKCALPRPPNNGRYVIRSRSPVGSGSFVDEDTYLRYTCNSGYTLKPNQELYACVQGQWSPSKLPTCTSNRRKSWWHIL